MLRYLITLLFLTIVLQCTEQKITPFNGNQAFEQLLTQEAMPPRIPGTPGQEIFLEWAERLLHEYGWETRRQPFEAYYQQIGENRPMTNLIASLNPIEKDNSIILLGAHFDTRAFADEDPDFPAMPVPGANDGASGVAVLMETARVLSRNFQLSPQYNIVMVFFDGEDGGITSRYFCKGSRYFTRNEPLTDQIEFAVILDMVGKKNLQLFKEKYSHENAQKLVDSFWLSGEKYYPDNFHPTVKYEIYDDHVPFIDKGIPAFVVIDFDYPSWHTIQDTSDKCSPDSLQMVGDILLVFLEKHRIIKQR